MGVTMNDQQFNILSQLYQQQPESFTEEEVDALQNAANFKGFDIPRNQDAGDFNLFNTVKQLVTGFVEGFTTFDVGDKPRNTIEEIAHRVGDVMGFVGWIPGLGTAVKLGAMGAGKIAMALRAGAEGVEIASRITKGAEALRLKSIPMMAADWLVGKSSRLIETPGLQAIKFLGTDASNVLKGVATLGIASGIGAAPIYDLSWDTLTNKRLGAMVEGGLFGAGQEVLGQLISRGGAWDASKILGIKPPSDEILAKADLGDSTALNIKKQWVQKVDMANNIARGLAASISMGLPAQLQSPDAPLALHIYDYLLNGAFGFLQKPYATRRAMEIFNEKASNPEAILTFMRPEKFDEYKNESPEVIDELKLWSSLEFGRIAKLDYDNQQTLVSSTGQDIFNVIGDVAKQLSPADATKILQVRYIQNRVSDMEQDLVEKGEEITPEKSQEIVDKALDDFVDVYKQNEADKAVDTTVTSTKQVLGSYVGMMADIKDAGLISFKTPIRDLADSIAEEAGVDSHEVEKRIVDKAIEFIGNPELRGEEGYQKFVDSINDIKNDILVQKDEKATESKAENTTENTVSEQNASKMPLEAQATEGISDEDINSALNDLYAGKTTEQPTESNNTSQTTTNEQPTEQASEQQQTAPTAAATTEQTVAPIEQTAAPTEQGAVNPEAELPKIDISNSKKKSPYFKKDLEKFSQANKLIAKGAERTSSRAYAEAVPTEQLNTDTYSPNDIVGISVNGGKNAKDDFEAIKPHIDKAIEAGATLIADKAEDRQRSYNLGERLVAKYLIEKGYKEVEDGMWQPTKQPIEEPIETPLPEKKQTVTPPSKYENALRQAYLTLDQVKKQVYEYNNGVVERQSEVGYKGERQLVYGSESLIERLAKTLGKKVIFLNKSVSKGKDGIESKDLFQEGSGFDFGKAVARMFSKGYDFLGGIKTKSSQVFMESFLDDPKTVAWKNAEVLKLLEEIDLRLEDFTNGKRNEQAKVLYEGLKEFSKLFTDKKLATDIYLKHIANMIKYLKLLNQDIPIKEQMEGKGFLNNVQKLTKRNQVLFAPEPELNGEFFKKYQIEHLDDNGFKFTIANATVPDEIEGMPDRNILYHEEDGKAVKNKKLSEVIRDGGRIWRNDAFDAILDFGGESRQAGFFKGVARWTDEHGLHITKAGNHRASKELDEWMHEKGIHCIEFNTTAKAYGNKKIADVRLTKDDKLEFSYDGKVSEPIIYNSPFHGNTYNLTTREPLKFKPIKVMKQLLTRIDDPKTQKIVMDNLILPRVKGEDETNELFEKWKQLIADPNSSKEEIEAIEKQIDIDSLGAQQILDTIANGIRIGDKSVVLKTGLYQKIMAHIIKEVNDSSDSEERIVDDDGIINPEADKFLQMDSTQRILTFFPNSPITFHIPFVDKYVQTAIRNYLIKRVISPKVDYAAKVISTPHDWFMEKKSYVEEGTYMLNKGMREMKLLDPWGEETTLGELWDEYQNLTKEQKDKLGSRYEEALTHVVGRAPADSASGIRILKFAGFTDTEGRGIYLHQSDMANMGGADNDGDSFMIYTTFGNDSANKAIREFYHSKKNMWSKELPDENGQMHWVMKDAKDAPEFYDKEKENPRIQSKWGLFDILALKDVHQYAYEANAMLGSNLNTGNRLYTLLLNYRGKTSDVSLRTNQVYMDETTMKNKPVFLKGKVYYTDDENKLANAIRSVINMSADAADGFKLKSAKEIQQTLMEKAIDKIEIKIGKETKTYLSMDEMTKDEELIKLLKSKDNPEGSISPFMIKDYGVLQKLDKYLLGKDFSKGINYDFLGTVEGLRDVADKVETTYPNIWYQMGLYFGRNFDINGVVTNPINWTGLNFKKILDVWNSMVSRPIVNTKSGKIRNFDINNGNFLQKLYKYLGRSFLGLNSNVEKVGSAIVAKEDKNNLVHWVGAQSISDASNTSQLVAQDFADVASAINVFRAIEKYMSNHPDDMAKVEAVAKAIESAKNDLKLFRKRDSESDNENIKKDSFETFEKKIKSIYLTLDDDMKPVADALLMNSWIRNSKDIVKNVKQVTKEIEKTKSELQDEKLSEKDREKKQKSLDRLEKQLNMLYQYKISSNFSSLPFKLDVINENSVKQLGTTFEDVAKLAMKPITEITEEKLTKLFLGDFVKEVIAPENPSLKGINSEREDNLERIEDYGKKVLLLSKDPTESYKVNEDLRRLKDILYNHPHLIKLFPDLFVSITGEGRLYGVRPELATPGDLHKVVEYLSNYSKAELSKTDFLVSPEAVGKKFNLFGLTHLRKTVKVLTEEGLKEHTIENIMGIINRQYKINSALARASEMYFNQIYNQYQTDDVNTLLGQIYESPEYQSNPDVGKDIMEFAVRTIEKDVTSKSNIYYAKYAEAKEKFEAKYKTDDEWLKLSMVKDGKTVKLGVNEIVNELVPKIQKFYHDARKQLLVNPEIEKKNIIKLGNSEFIDMDKTINRISEAAVNDEIIGSKHFLTMNGLLKLAHRLKLEKLRFNIQDSNGNTRTVMLRDLKWKDYKNAKAFFIQAGNHLVPFFNTIKIKEIENYVAHASDNVYLDQHSEVTRIADAMLKESILKTLKEYTIEGEGRNENGESEIYQYRPFSYLDDPEIGSWGASYWHHTNYDKQVIENARNEKIAQMYDKELKSDAQSFSARVEFERALSDAPDGGMSVDALEELEGHVIDLYPQDNFLAPSFTKSRSEDPLPGWSTSNDVREKYLEQINKSYWNVLTSLMNRHMINWVEEYKPFGEQNDQMINYMEVYMNNTLGRPSFFPKEILNDPKYKIKGTPFYWTSDQKMHDLFKKFKKYFNIEYTATEGEDKGKKFSIKVPTDSETGKQLMMRKAVAFSQLEGKYELISLLASTKTLFNNIFDAYKNTIIDMGFESFWKARDLNYFKQLNPAWDSWEKVNKFVEEHGGLESFYKDMFALSDYKGQEFSKMFSIAKDIIKDNPEISDKNLIEKMKVQVEALRKNNELVNVTKDKISNFLSKAGWFMRYSERKTRLKAWLTAYVNGVKTLMPTTHSFAYDDPILIQFANKSVENSQFIYNSATRPAFAATTMGKVFARFQIFTFNSIKFRKNMIKLAAEQGYRPYTPEYKRLQRFITADVFVLSLASMLPFSIFETSLPQPYGIISNMNQFLFGNDDEKRKAFYGVLPYPANLTQIVVPPAFRIPQMFLGVALGNWNYVDSTVWTLFPFGRLIHDSYKTIVDPSKLVENFSGLPIHRLNQVFKKTQKEDQSNEDLNINLQSQ